MENENQISKISFEKLILPGSILLAAIIISVSLIATRGGLYKNQAAQIGQEAGVVKVDTDDDPFLGPKNAKVTIVEFSDFQCPFCRTFWRESFNKIKEKYIDTGKVKFVYRDFPLDFHPAAMPFALAADCANEQGKFWEFHDKIFSEQDKKGQGTVAVEAADIKKWISEVSLDQNKFNTCFDSGKYKNEIAKDYKDGVSYGVGGTPTLFINGRKLVGAQPFENFASVIDEELQK